jgi:hypothetical protein
MKIYHSARSICEEQHDIMEEGLDVTNLSLVLGALPRLKEVDLDFRKDLPGLSSGDVRMAEKSHEHHIRVISIAMEKARNCGISINSLSLRELNIPDCEGRDHKTLSEVLGELVCGVQTLRLTDSSSVLELLSRSSPKLFQLDMCDLIVRNTALKVFFKTNTHIQWSLCICCPLQK